MIHQWSQSVTINTETDHRNSCGSESRPTQPSECGRQHTLNIVHVQTAAQQQSNGIYEAREMWRVERLLYHFSNEIRKSSNNYCNFLEYDLEKILIY